MGISGGSLGTHHPPVSEAPSDVSNNVLCMICLCNTYVWAGDQESYAPYLCPLKFYKYPYPFLTTFFGFSPRPLPAWHGLYIWEIYIVNILP